MGMGTKRQVENNLVSDSPRYALLVDEFQDISVPMLTSPAGVYGEKGWKDFGYKSTPYLPFQE